MGTRENILDPEESYLSPGHPELSLSSGIISLPSANKLADLSLASDLTDSEAENEPTILTSRPCGDFNDGAHEIFQRENRKIASDTLNSSMLSYSQKSVSSMEKPSITETSTYRRFREMPSRISKERYTHEGIVSDEEPSRDFCPSKNTTQGEAVPSLPSLSLDAVRGTLQQHCNLLSDRHLLKDLLESLGEKIEQKPEPGVSVQSPYSGRELKIDTHEKCMDNDLKGNSNALGVLDKQFPSQLSTMFSPKSHFSECTSNTNFDQGSHVLNEAESLMKSQLDYNEAHAISGSSQEHVCTTMPNSKPTGQEVLQKLPSYGRHVKLQLPTSSAQDSPMNAEGDEYDGKKELCNTHQSLKVLQKLAGLRWSLFGWADVRSSPPTDSSSSLAFLHHLLNSLQTLQLEKKHLKEELATASEELNLLSEECYIKRHLHEKREARLVEADRQLGELQQVWAATHEAGQQEMAKLRSHCHALIQENASLKKETEGLRMEVMELKATTRQHDLIKTRAEETQELLAASQKKVVEVLEENARVNLCLEENRKCLRVLEEVKIPELHRDLKDVQTRAGRLEDTNEVLSHGKAQVEDELHMLQEQYKILLGKIVEEQERTTKAEQQKLILEKELKGTSEKVEAMKTKLHLHYQAQVEELVAKKSATLQKQLKSLESNLEKNVEEKLQSLEESHQAACEKLKKRHENEIKNIKTSYESELEKLHAEVNGLKQENDHLQLQRQGVVSAVSSIFGLEHQMSDGPSMHPSSAKPVGASSHSLNVVRNGSSTSGIHPTSDKSPRKLPHFKFKSSSSSESGSSLFAEGKQTARHFSENSQQCLPPETVTSQNFYQKYQEKDLVVSSDYGKIRRASEILQASYLTDEDGCFLDEEVMLYIPREDQKMMKMLRELKMVSQSSEGPQSEAPTHDTSLDQDPAAPTLHKLSQVS
ncbi:uncharacterized protein LOC126996613 isoform X2 [Eriocheir sinensis]|uniref:uncharacterized protein LOC126996613 isoform X2 n=1 Tax=Eriocheir sinensis TaxID=95602 RepID=UPI0021CA8175|nr:uncharacterized protein LOC126996613 isoform X2 [Eriocheir sinensis]